MEGCVGDPRKSHERTYIFLVCLRLVVSEKKSNENSSVLLSTPFVIMPRTASNDRLVAIGLLRAGLTIGDVARRYGVTHVARIVTAYLNENNIPVLPWPANSLDMSPIEQLFGTKCKEG